MDVFTCGKHSGRSFGDVRDNEPGYAQWALKQGSPSGGLLKFIDFINAPVVTPRKCKVQNKDGTQLAWLSNAPSTTLVPNMGQVGPYWKPWVKSIEYS